LLAFIGSIGASVFILVPRRDHFTFSLSGPGLYEGLYEVRDDLAEVYRRLAYDLLDFWQHNDEQLQPLFRAYRVGTGALVVEILASVALVSVRSSEHAPPRRQPEAPAASRADAWSRPARDPWRQRRRAALGAEPAVG
jgi:hypothetical protein